MLESIFKWPPRGLLKKVGPEKAIWRTPARLRAQDLGAPLYVLR